MQQGDQGVQGDDLLTEQIIGGCIAVHRALGPGLLESAYEHCLAQELGFRAIPFRRQVEIGIEYRGSTLDCGYRIDFLIADRIVLELKSVEHLQPIHVAQVLTYLRLGGYSLALLINFNVTSLRQGLRRLALRPDNFISR
jgi:GxxExxY protein